MKDTILSILNESSAELTVEKAKKIAEILIAVPSWDADELEPVALDILQSFESFKKIRLEEGQFVIDEDVVTEAIDATDPSAIIEAQQKVIFAGFEKASHETVWINKYFYFGFEPKQITLPSLYHGARLLVETPTIGDLLAEIQRYNKAAPEPINLKFTENILPLMGVKI